MLLFNVYLWLFVMLINCNQMVYNSSGRYAGGGDVSAFAFRQ